MADPPATRHSSPVTREAFTLVELLTVIAIIGLLAAMLLSVLARVKQQARIRMAMVQIGQIVRAISEYESAYGKFPASTMALNAAVADPDPAKRQDFTFGTFGLPDLKTPGGTQPILNPSGMTYNANNSEIMAVLLDLEKFPNGTATINAGHTKNPGKGSLLPATMVSDTNSPGVGLDGVYRDPWGNPYIISVDLNNDSKCRDAYHSNPQVSAGTGGTGLNGLIQTTIGANIYYEASASVMVWSAGPDGKIEYPPAAGAATKGANKDNILSWK